MSDKSEEEEGPFPCSFTPEVPEGQWQIEVLQGADGGDYRTVFSSGCQHFTICEAEAGDEEGHQRCLWYRDRFRTAMRNLGAPGERGSKQSLAINARAGLDA